MIKNQYFFILKMILDKPQFNKDLNHFIENNMLQLIEMNYTYNSDIYKSRVLGHLVNQQWEQYGLKQYKKQGLYYLIYLFLYTFQQFKFGADRLTKDNKIEDDYTKTVVISLNSFLLIMILLQLRSEYKQCMSLNRQFRHLYIGRFWNLLEVSSNLTAIFLIILDMVFLLLNFNDKTSIVIYQSLMMVSLFFYWIVATKYLRAFENFSSLVHLIHRVLVETKEFLVFMGLCLFSFYILFYLYQLRGYYIMNGLN